MRIGVGGNIGAGKTTYAVALADALGYSIAEEPNEINPFIDDFYKNPKEYAFKTQVFFISSRKHSLGDQNSRNIIFDRTIYEDRIFAEVQHARGNMDDREMLTYELFYAALMRDVEPPDLYVEIRASPIVCMKRIRKRGRPNEATIDMQYLEQLDDLYERFWVDIQEKCPVLVVDAEGEVDCESAIEIVERKIKSSAAAEFLAIGR